MTCVRFRRCLILALLSFQYGEASEKFEGDVCTNVIGITGVCTSIEFCPQVHETLKKFEERPLLCSFNRSTPIVCCTPPITTDRFQTDDTDKNVGSLADKYCRKYSEFTYTWVPSLIIDRAGSLINTCRQRPPDVADEPYAEPQSREFPHMIAFGVGPADDIKWVCSGTLISDKFVVTTARCAMQTGGQPAVQWAQAGDFNLYDPDDDALIELKAVNQIFVHPQYDSIRNKNDIALVKLQKRLQLSRYVIPACLPVGKFSTDKALVTSWHMTKNEGDLTRVTVNIVPESECSNITMRKMRNRPRNSKSSKICAKPKFPSDYCQRNSGDPLQFYRPGIHCMYDIIGLTSEFGTSCESYASYTDISSYIGWIERRVWGPYVGQDKPESGQTSTDYSVPSTTIQTATEYSRPTSRPGSRPNTTPRPIQSTTQNYTQDSFYNVNSQSAQTFYPQNSSQTNQEAALMAALGGRPFSQGQLHSRNVTYVNNRINWQNSTGRDVIPIGGRNEQVVGRYPSQEYNRTLVQNSDQLYDQQFAQRNGTIYSRLTFN